MPVNAPDIEINRLIDTALIIYSSIDIDSIVINQKFKVGYL